MCLWAKKWQWTRNISMVLFHSLVEVGYLTAGDSMWTVPKHLHDLE